MRLVAKYPGLQAAIEWYQTLDEDTMTKPGGAEPYAIIRREKPSGGSPNLIPNRRALNHLEQLDERIGDLIWRDKEYGDHIHDAPEQSEIERRRERDRIRQADYRARQV